MARRALTWVALALIASCNSAVPVHSYTYACTTSDQCASGWTCQGGRCAQGGGANTQDVGADTEADVASGQEAVTEPEITVAEIAAETAVDSKPACKATEINCLTNCAVSSCPMQAYACNQDPDCMKVLTCYVACKDTPCRFGCIGNAPTGTKSKVEDLAKCLASNCM